MPLPPGLTAGDLAVALGLPLVSGALVMLLLTAGGRPGWRRAVIGWAVATAAGFESFYLGQVWFIAGKQLPAQFSAWDTLDRIAFIVVPFAALVVVLLTGSKWLRWIGTALGAVVTLGLAPLLMQNYLTGLVGDWSWAERLVWFLTLGVGTLAIWRNLAMLERRGPGRGTALGLAGIAGGFAGMMMLSDSVVVGLRGLVLMAVLLGGLLGTFRLPRGLAAMGVSGVGWLVLVSLLINGRFYGETDPATIKYVLLGLAPLMLWVGEDPWVRYRRPWVNGLVRVLAVALPVALAIGLAAVEFVQQQNNPSPYG
jgi:hypothetical protein